MGVVCCNLPICLAEWRACINGVRVHRGWLRRFGHRPVFSRNGIYVGNILSLGWHCLLTERRDPTVGAQYRWSANLAPAYPKFWGLIQGLNSPKRRHLMT